MNNNKSQLIKRKMLAGISATVLAGALSSNNALADDATLTGQFMTVQNTPISAQQDLLAQTFQVRFPLSVITVSDAMKYLLQDSGYQLVKGDSFAQQMFAAPLPIVDRTFGPMTLSDGLTTLAGSHFQMVIDPINRLITFRLKPALNSLFINNTQGGTNS